MSTFSNHKIIAAASEELEHIRRLPTSIINSNTKKKNGNKSNVSARFPPICRTLLYSLPGNSCCVDCGNPGPDWASVTYGCLLCLQCSGRHRSYGVGTSFVRSISMDHWSHTEILAMLEGGNEQLSNFFDRHRMGSDSAMVNKRRYLTKAAKFYGTNLAVHIENVAAMGAYQGREASRNMKHKHRAHEHHQRSMAETRSAQLQQQQQQQQQSDKAQQQQQQQIQQKQNSFRLELPIPIQRTVSQQSVKAQ